jgi:serine phosphatase RsbU (regulator of sigma subunit)
MDRPSLDQLAQITEPQMVRRRFDEHNLVWGYVISWPFAIVSLIFIIASFFVKKQRPFHLPAMLIDAAMTLFILAAISELRKARRRESWKPNAYARMVGRNLTAWLIAVFVVKFATLVFLALSDNSAWIAWAVIFPPLTMALRLLPRQRLVLHGWIMAVVIAAALAVPVSGKPVHKVPVYVPLFMALGMVNVFCFTVGALTSRGVKRTAIEEGTQRRTEAREQLRIRDELRFAREVQISMLPEAPPQLAWADVAGISLPASEVGGDYYDYYVVDGRLAIVCGDVAGHGLASGITLSALRSGFTLLRDELLDPAHVLERLQEVVTHSSRRRMMVTISVLLLDPQTHHATVASAGHPPLLHIRGTDPLFIELHSLPLGARLGESVPQQVVPFASGDLFVMHSDGIYEAMNEKGETYGLERLGRVVAAASGTAEQIRDAVLRDVEAFRGTEPQQDDVTIVVVRTV